LFCEVWGYFAERSTAARPAGKRAALPDGMTIAHLGLPWHRWERVGIFFQRLGHTVWNPADGVAYLFAALMLKVDRDAALPEHLRSAGEAVLHHPQAD